MSLRLNFLTIRRLSLALLLSLGCLCPLESAHASQAKWKKYTVEGATAYKEQRFGDAERSFQQAIKEAEQFGDNDIRLASSLANLGVLYNYRGFFDKAEPLFEKSVQIKVKKLGENDNDVISSTGKLCQFYLKLKEFERADPLAAKLISYGQKRLSELERYKADQKKDKKEYQKVINQYLELAVLFDRMAQAYLGHPINGRYPNSEKLYKLSLGLREKTLTGNHLALSASYENLGKLYLKEHRYSLAEPLLKKSYNASKSTLGFAKPVTYTKMDAWCQALAGLGRARQAENNYHQALRSFIEGYGAHSGYVANIEIALGHLLARSGKYSQASQHIKKALRIETKLKGPQHAYTASLSKDYASMLRKARRTQEADKYQASLDNADQSI